MIHPRHQNPITPHFRAKKGVFLPQKTCFEQVFFVFPPTLTIFLVFNEKLININSKRLFLFFLHQSHTRKPE